MHTRHLYERIFILALNNVYFVSVIYCRKNRGTVKLVPLVPVQGLQSETLFKVSKYLNFLAECFYFENCSFFLQFLCAID